MLTLSLVTAAGFVGLIAPAVGLQLFLGRVWNADCRGRGEPVQARVSLVPTPISSRV